MNRGNEQIQAQFNEALLASLNAGIESMGEMIAQKAAEKASEMLEDFAKKMFA